MKQQSHTQAKLYVPRDDGAAELQLFAVIFGIEKFQQYLSSNVPFKVITDHAAIVPLLKTKKPALRLAKWLLRISCFLFQVVIDFRRENVLADVSSRYPMQNYDEIIKSFFTIPLFFTTTIDIEKLNGKVCSVDP